MNVNGKLHEVSNVPLFISSYTANPAHPNPASFKPLAEAQIFLGTDFPAGYTNSGSQYQIPMKKEMNYACNH
jgi:hypothetical protein